MRQELKVLLVEDNPADARLVKEALIDCQIAVDMQEVCDGEEAFKYVSRLGKYDKASRPDLIILDLNMPKKNGHEFLNDSKRILDEEDIPVILLTASDREPDIQKALDKKMNFYLCKPVNAHKLKTVLCAIGELWSTDAVAV